MIVLCQSTNFHFPNPNKITLFNALHIRENSNPLTQVKVSSLLCVLIVVILKILNATWAIWGAIMHAIGF